MMSVIPQSGWRKWECSVHGGWHCGVLGVFKEMGSGVYTYDRMSHHVQVLRSYLNPFQWTLCKAHDRHRVGHEVSWHRTVQ